MSKLAKKKKKRASKFLNGAVHAGLGIMHLLALLPRPMKHALQRIIFLILYYFPTEMRSVAQQNIAACFPELDKPAQNQLLRKTFADLATTLVESLNMPWPSKTAIFPTIGRIEGVEHIEQALAQKQGVLLLFPHFMAVYLVGFLLISRVNFPFALMYHAPKNPVLANFFAKNINKYCQPAFTRNDVRQMVKYLREGHVVWYAPDLEPNKKAHAVFAPFFNIPAATYTTTARIAELSSAVTLPIAFYRRENEAVYDVIFGPPVQDFPDQDSVKNAIQINKIMEDIVRKKPEQYLWTYSRFSRDEKWERRFYTKK